LPSWHMFRLCRHGAPLKHCHHGRHAKLLSGQHCHHGTCSGFAVMAHLSSIAIMADMQSCSQGSIAIRAQHICHQSSGHYHQGSTHMPSGLSKAFAIRAQHICHQGSAKQVPSGLHTYAIRVQQSKCHQGSIHMPPGLTNNSLPLKVLPVPLQTPPSSPLTACLPVPVEP